MTTIAFANAMESTQLNIIAKGASTEAFKNKKYVDNIGVSLLKSKRIIKVLNTSVTTIATAVTQKYMADKCKDEIPTRLRDKMKTLADKGV